MAEMKEYIIKVNVSSQLADECLKVLQAKELVNCKECKWFIKKFENEGRCIKHDNDYHDPDWFCADGEVKE